MLNEDVEGRQRRQRRQLRAATCGDGQSRQLRAATGSSQRAQRRDGVQPAGGQSSQRRPPARYTRHKYVADATTPAT